MEELGVIRQKGARAPAWELWGKPRVVGRTRNGGKAKEREGQGAGRRSERRGQTGSRAPKGHNGAQDAEAICENRRGREQEVWGGRRQREKRRHLGDIEASWGTGGGATGERCNCRKIKYLGRETG